MKFKAMKKTLAGLAVSLTIAGFAMPAHAAETYDRYITQENDTFWSISQKLHIKLEDLLSANSTVDPLNVYEGLTFKVPSTRMVSAAANIVGNPSITKLNTMESKSVTSSNLQNSIKSITGETMNYSKVISGIATAYSESPQENGWGPVDYFGNPLQIGTIAVDPKVIPLGTKVYITGYTFKGLPKALVATAKDMGGSIQGNHVDIFIPSSMGNADDFGIQNVQLYILK
jgi:3D (Asp-Asp-Asp) domain-containing protein